MNDIKMKYRALILMDRGEGAGDCKTGELVTAILSLPGTSPEETAIVVAGNDVKREGDELSARYGMDVLLLDDPDLSLSHPGLFARLVGAMTKDSPPELICMVHTPASCLCGGHLSVELGGSLITGVEGISLREGAHTFRRQLLGGVMEGEVKSLREPCIFTLVPGAFSPFSREEPQERGRVFPVSLPVHLERGMKPLGLEMTGERDTALEQADVIVAAGRGIGNRDNLSLIEETAKLFRQGTVGASRPLCDNRWIPFSRQVGITGKSVSPRLYLACGISGSSQHIAGITGAQMIVAVNTDPNAAIFSVAHYIVVEDLMVFLPLLMEKMKK